MDGPLLPHHHRLRGRQPGRPLDCLWYTHASLLTLRWRFHKNCHLYAFASQPQRHQNSQPNIFSLLSQSHRAKALQKDYKLLLYLSNWFIQNFKNKKLKTYPLMTIF